MNDIKVKLEDVCERGSSNLAQKDLEKLTGDYPVYGASGYIKDIDFYHQENEYIAVVKDGAGIGRTVFLPGKSSVIGTLQYLVPKDNIVPKYLYYTVTSMKLEKYYTGATIPHIYFKDYKKEILPLPNKNIQLEIVSILEKAEKIISYRKQQLEDLDNLIKSRFVEMFGDPVHNPFGWSIKPFMECGSCKNGMNFGAGETGVELQYLGVGDFKNLTKIEEVTKLGQVSLNKMPGEDYLLKNGDIVFVRSNGNKALVGRCLAVYPNGVPTTYSGFCIRYRNTDESLEIPYLLQVLKTESMRLMMAGRGANIQNLNQQILGQLQIPIPPNELQREFGQFIEQVDKLKVEVQKSLDESQMLFDSLMQKYFS